MEPSEKSSISDRSAYDRSIVDMTTRGASSRGRVCCCPSSSSTLTMECVCSNTLAATQAWVSCGTHRRSEEDGRDVEEKEDVDAILSELIRQSNSSIHC